MPELPSAIIAGSKSFVQAVQPQLQLRLGALPGVARDPAEALQAAGGGGIFVVECSGPPWVEAVRSLRGRCAPGALSIVAAVPPGSAAEVQPLRSAGADEVVAWQGRPDPVVWAVDRVVARARASGAGGAKPAPLQPLTAQTAPLQRAAQPVAPSPRPAPPPRAPAPPGFDALEIVEGTPLPVAEERAGGLAVPSAADQAAPELGAAEVASSPADGAAPAWPNAVPCAADSEALLVGAVAGHQLPADALRAPIERVVAALTSLERAALAGALAPELAVLRSASACRLRLAVALGTAPGSSAGADQEAAQRLLAEVDGVLLAVKELAAGASAEVAPELALLRLALIDGGVELAGAVSRLGQAMPELVAEVRPTEAKPATRVLSNEAAPEPQRVRRGPLIAFAVVSLLVAAYHVVDYTSRPAPRHLPTVPGAPANAIVVPRGSGWLLTAQAGKKIDPAELDAFKAKEQAKGNVVRKIGSATWMIDSGAGRGAKP